MIGRDGEGGRQSKASRQYSTPAMEHVIHMVRYALLNAHPVARGVGSSLVGVKDLARTSDARLDKAKTDQSGCLRAQIVIGV